MSSPDQGFSPRRPLRAVVAALGMSLALGGCFTPLYAERTPGTGVQSQLTNVHVRTVEGRVGMEMRNALIFELTGGAGNLSGAPYQLEAKLTEDTQSMTIDPVTGRATVEIVSLTVSYQLRDAANDKVLIRDTAFGQASIERGAQIFARDRAKRDAENRAAKIVAEQIRGRLASYFTAPTPPPPPPPTDKTAGRH
jgi:LPS-assembly lipoprotein